MSQHTHQNHIFRTLLTEYSQKLQERSKEFVKAQRIGEEVHRLFNLQKQALEIVNRPFGSKIALKNANRALAAELKRLGFQAFSTTEKIRYLFVI